MSKRGEKKKQPWFRLRAIYLIVQSQEARSILCLEVHVIFQVVPMDHFQVDKCSIARHLQDTTSVETVEIRYDQTQTDWIVLEMDLVSSRRAASEEVRTQHQGISPDLQREELSGKEAATLIHFLKAIDVGQSQHREIFLELRRGVLSESRGFVTLRLDGHPSLHVKIKSEQRIVRDLQNRLADYLATIQCRHQEHRLTLPYRIADPMSILSDCL